MSKKSYYGKGFNSKGKHKATINGTYTLAYNTWRNMIARCYCPKGHEKSPVYIGCSVANEWLDFQGFADWFESHEYINHGYELDKDILVPNNKVYGPDTCCFVPQELNSLLISRASARGDLPQGVYLYKPTSKFMAAVGVDGKRRHLGYFDTPQEAYLVYKVAKEANVKRMALKWQDRIANNVFDALMAWELDPK